jgi:hypothetical protein
MIFDMASVLFHKNLIFLVKHIQIIYKLLLIQLNMIWLADRKKIVDLKFFYINCPEVLNHLNFYVMSYY